MGEYQVIARKWRPQRFSDVVGQEHILQTLKNAVKNQRTAHAYLFVGPRGIGKTTTARIFAKALNCYEPVDGEPCCECESCVAIANESSMDVIEIDAASRNSVENIRELRDEVMHVPSRSRYKVYIIDEVHMLSKQAWNALLKTIEEPPPHAKFIFATTEVHMVLGTIISRCQRFDLQRIGTNLIAERLAMIAEAENVNISRAAVNAIARAADGGMRDAQSLLDQMIAFFSSTHEEISEEKVLSLFGLTASADIEAILTAMMTNNKAGLITGVYHLASHGKNLETLFNDLLNALRSIQISCLMKSPENILETDSDSVQRYRQLGANVPPHIVQILLESLSPVGRTLHDALNKQVYLETIILKAMREAHAVRIEDLITRLNQIRKSGELAGLEKLPPLSSIPVQAPPQAPQPMPAQIQQPAPAPVAEVKPEPPQPAVAEKKTEPQPEPVVESCPEPEPVVEEIKPEPQSEPALAEENVVEEAPVKTAPEPVEVIKPEPVAEKAEETPTVEEAPAIEEAVSETENFDLEPPPAETIISEDDIPRKIWQEMIMLVNNHHEANPLLRQYMSEATPVSWEGSILTVRFDPEYDLEHYQTLVNQRKFLHGLLQQVSDDWMGSICIEKSPGMKQLVPEDTVKEDEDSLDEPVPEEIPEDNLIDAIEPAPEEQPEEAERAKSIFGIQDEMDKIHQNVFVQEAVKTFKGRIVDLHASN